MRVVLNVVFGVVGVFYVSIFFVWKPQFDDQYYILVNMKLCK